MNLIAEYQNRHKNHSSIPLAHDGLCFFDYNGQPGLIAMTSLACRSFSTCPSCDDKKANIILEFFTPGYAGSFQANGHHHVDPCGNLLKIMKGMGFQNYEPYYASDARDLEVWLWKFCSLNSRMRGLKSVETDKKMKVIEQMVHAAQKHPKLYNAYFITYEAFLPSRKYLLFR